MHTDRQAASPPHTPHCYCRLQQLAGPQHTPVCVQPQRCPHHVSQGRDRVQSPVMLGVMQEFIPHTLSSASQEGCHNTQPCFRYKDYHGILPCFVGVAPGRR